MRLPAALEPLVAGEDFRLDQIGMSRASVLLGREKVLKIQPAQPEADREAKLLTWLRGKLPVPEVLHYEVAEGTAYLLMSRAPGEMACSPRYLDDPKALCRLLAETLRALWSVDCGDCPADQRLSQKLAAAERQVALGLVDVENTQPDTFGSGGFRDPEALLRWLYENQPEEDLVFSHGDLCLPNLFFCQGRLSGLIDLGRGGVGDRWNDLALCCRSLTNNFSGQFGGPVREGYDPALLFRELGIEPNEEKLRYYILLDELF